MNVLYEDNHLIAVWKEAGVLTQSSKIGDDNLLDQVRAYLKKTYNKPGNVFVGLLHRLDRNVSGIVLFAKTSKGASRLSEQIRNHKIQKTYQALVVGETKPTESLTHYLLKDQKSNHTTVFDAEHAGAKAAELTYHTLAIKNGKSLIEIELKTGRSHQIRAQLSHIGHPLVGDTKYGGPKTNDGAIRLVASQLSFTTATGEKQVDLQAPQKLIQRAIIDT